MFLADTRDGQLLFVKSNLNRYKAKCEKKEFPIKVLEDFKQIRRAHHYHWEALPMVGVHRSTLLAVKYPLHDMLLLGEFPETFLPWTLLAMHRGDRFSLSLSLFCSLVLCVFASFSLVVLLLLLSVSVVFLISCVDLCPLPSFYLPVDITFIFL